MFKSISSQSLPVIKSEKESNPNLNSDNLNNYEILKKRKEALEKTLNLKLLQLKSLCLKEANITGELPVETPLNPEEPMPQIRKRIGAEFNLNQSLFSKSKSIEEENLAQLEIEFELQRKIVKANFKLSNENSIKKSVRKKRTKNYHDAILKLKSLEEQLIEMRIKMDEKDGVDSSHKITLIKSESDCNLDKISFIDQQSKCSDELNEEKNLISSAFDLCSNSSPPTPVKFKEAYRLPCPSSPSFKPISPPLNGFIYRSSSTHFPSENKTHADQNDLSQKANTAHHFVNELDVDSSSIESSSSCDSNLFKTINNKKRKNILSLLQTPLSNESIDLISSHIYTLPTKRTSISSNDDSLSKILTSDSGLTETVSKLSRSESDTLIRHDSLDNSRRKSYISAIQYLPAELNRSCLNRHYHHHHYHNHKPISRDSESKPSKSVSTATDATSTLTLNMAQRPLPPPPSSPIHHTLPPLPPTSTSTLNDQRSSSSSSLSTSISNNYKPTTELYQNVPEIKKVSSEIRHDISIRAVRSSIIRTPVAITVSTTTSSDASATIKPPTPAPSLPPRNSANLQVKVEQHFFGQTSKTFNFDTSATISRFPAPKTWSETTIDKPPTPSDSNESEKLNPFFSKPLESNLHHSEFIQPRSSCSGDDDQIDSFSDQQSKRGSISSKSNPNPSPRPLSIQMSPTLSSSGNGVEVNVVSVGHFQPYWEETKPYELSDFYKYSTKHRKKANSMPKPPPSSSNSATVIDSDEQKKAKSREKKCQKEEIKINRVAKSSLPSDSKFSEITFSMSDESFISKTSVSTAFREEMLDWYENEVKKPTLV